MNDYQRTLPSNNDLARQTLYSGSLFLLPATAASLSLVEHVTRVMQTEFPDSDSLRTAQFHHDSEDFFARAGRLRKHFYTRPEFHQMVCDVITSAGFSPLKNAFDPIRLRIVTHEGHTNPAAQAIYYGHRDTWYANPQSMLTWWIPLHDVTAAETFEFFPDDFARPVDNDSEVFDFDAWVAKGQEKRIGWQNRQTGREARYPQLRDTVNSRRIPVVARAGEILIFSAQQLHQTRPNLTGQTRFSIDFRTVHLEDHAAGREAVNVDNRSTGSSLVQFVRGSDFVDKPRPVAERTDD